ncbi:MAG: nucleotidyltransferase [Solirubrobacterales bacterium]
METLSSQFSQAISNITVNGGRRGHAIAAHSEIRALLETNPLLRGFGVDTVLIGSYGRRTGIYPGKDVDVFVKLTELDTASEPSRVFEAVHAPLLAHFGEGRVTPQARSVKVSYDVKGHEFSVDAVPAVRFNGRWAIPTHDRDFWTKGPQERWVETDPELLTKLTEARNKVPLVEGDGAYVPTVKFVRQIRSHHLGDAKPGGFYFELACYWAFERGEVSGSSYAEILATSLRSIARQLASGGVLTDPVLGRPFAPAPGLGDLQSAATAFAALASQAEAALQAERCPAAAIWQRLLGANSRGNCFPLPSGCDESGRAITRVTPVGAQGAGAAGGFG